jgi:hypothetical protein
MRKPSTTVIAEPKPIQPIHNSFSLNQYFLTVPEETVIVKSPSVNVIPGPSISVLALIKKVLAEQPVAHSVSKHGQNPQQGRAHEGHLAAQPGFQGLNVILFRR